MRAPDGVILGPVTDTPAAFELAGGRYLGTVIAGTWTSGTAALWMLGPDNSTYVSVSSNLSANGGWVLDLPPGKYQVQFTGAVVGGYVTLVRVPGE